jgi:hypothetical protein
MPAYMEDLAEIIAKACQTPNCTHKHTKLVVVARCHPKAGINAIIDAITQTIVIRCRECEQNVAEIKIASRGKQALVGL